MTSNSGELLALVKWVGGVDDKKYTTGINVAHIKNFNEKKFLNDEEDPEKVYIVEWHDGPEPLRCWICYNARVIAISKKITVLEKKFKALDGMRSPRRVDPKLFDNDVALKAKKPQKIEKKREAYSESSSSILKKLQESNTESTDDGKNTKQKTELYHSERALLEISEQIIEDTTRKMSVETLKEVQKESYEITEATSKKSSEKTSVIADTETPTVEADLIDSHDTNSPNSDHDISGQAKSNELSTAGTSAADGEFSPKHHSSSKTKSNPEKGKMKELGLPGSGVFIPEAQFNVAERAQSATAMATSLLMSVFSRSVIANSNLRSGKSKTKNSTVQHSTLDSDKLTAIHDAVEKRFKRRYNNSEINRAINVKCSRVRSEEKEAKAHEGAKKPKLDGESDVKP
ncbi:uncharacterized protein LOC123270080 [Cotesia glomerata]|uniref:BEN domain-containing protein n=1 Tax=Cotesia glomerata TaxID=32391 RepID=A0AAV7IL83_COTGL|nr:uncharacterized protein LOC123270080 [Cotesia glomerata]KAH0552480.1 hypothetical protein KQX54_010761 [Cotesia glomerata]